MVKAFDLSKFRKTITGKIAGISTGFHDPKTWISTTNYTLNYLISGQFNRGIPLSQITMFAGQSGSGKSLIAASIIKEALSKGILVIVIDTENGYTKEWLENTGVEIDKYIDSGQFLRIQVALIDDLAATLDQAIKTYAEENEGLDQDEKIKLLIVVDSLGMLLTRTDVNQFEAGDLKGDMGRKAKAITAVVKNCVVRFAEHEIGLLATNHSYASQDMFDPDDKISGGQGFIYASSIVVAMRKAKLKEDEEGNKSTDVLGIRALIKVMKSRYNKPFEGVEVRIPYEKGIDPYSGLVDLFEKKNILEKDGNKLRYVDLSGNEHKYFRKHFFTEEGHQLLDLIMKEFDKKIQPINLGDIKDLEELANEEQEREELNKKKRGRPAATNKGE